jgi:drug/metabolite transporter (DMT)-like permease
VSGFFAGVFAIPIGLFISWTGRSLGDAMSIIMLIGIGGLYYAGIMIYLKMLKDEDSSSVVSWFQIVPLFGIVGALFLLGEVPQWYHFLAIIVIVVGGFILSYNKDGMNWYIILWMVVATGMIALYDVMFASYGRDIDEFSAIFLMLIGKTIFGFVYLIFDGEARRGFVMGMNTKSTAMFVSESVNTLADIALYGSLLFLPVYLVQGVCSMQPIFVLIGAILLGKIFPEIQEEDEGEDFRKKVFGITLLIMGGILLM